MLSASQRIRRVKERGAEGWLWRTGSFAGQFGDPYIQNTGTRLRLRNHWFQLCSHFLELEGGLVGPSLKKLNEIVRKRVKDIEYTKKHLPLSGE